MTNKEDSTSIPTKVIKTPYDYHYLIQYISQQGKRMYGPNYTITDMDRPIVTQLLSYFLRDEAVATSQNIDLNKGILLMGPIGCGKTSLMNIMRGLSQPCYKPVMKSCREISHEFSEQGYEIIGKYSRHAFFAYTNIPLVHCFDDLGMESPIVYWGNNINVLGEILACRYDLFISHKMISHATTNLNSDDLEENYGNRLRSRMREMFNLIIFDSQSSDKRK